MGGMNAFTKFHGISSNNCQDILLWTENVKLMVVLVLILSAIFRFTLYFSHEIVLVVFSQPHPFYFQSVFSQQNTSHFCLDLGKI